MVRMHLRVKTTISWYKISGKQNFSSNITPIKMAADVFKTETTNLGLPPLVIMHGLFGSKQNWRGIGKGLERTTKRKIYNVDARNHGDSPHDSNHSTAHMVADVAFLLQEEQMERVSVLGHSIGGSTMMYFALKYPELVEKAIVVDISPVSIPRHFGTLDEIFDAMKKINVSPKLSMAEGRPLVEQQLTNALGDKEVADFIMLNLRKSKTGEFEWRLNVETLQSTFGHFRNVQQFNMPPYTGPVLFIGGRQSSFINPEDWPKIKKIFPNATLKWLDSGHLVHFEQPVKFMELVSDFLNN